MSMDDLSYLQALMGRRRPKKQRAGTGGAGRRLGVVDPRVRRRGRRDAAPGRQGPRRGGRARRLRLPAGCGSPAEDAAQRAIHAGADHVLTAAGMPTLADLTAFFRERGPQAVLFPRTRLGRTLGPGLAQTLGGGLCGYAADLAVDPMSQRVLAHQPVLDDAARQVVAILASPAVVVVDTACAARGVQRAVAHGQRRGTGLAWPAAPEHPAAELPAKPVRSVL